MQISKQLKLAMEQSLKMSQRLRSSKIETESLLYGILTVEDSEAVKLLVNAKLNKFSYEKVLLSHSNQPRKMTQVAQNYSTSVSQIFAKSTNFCEKNSIKTLNIEEILYFLLANQNCKATKILSTVFRCDVRSVQAGLAKIIEKQRSLNPVKTTEKQTLNSPVKVSEKLKGFCENLNDKVKNLTQKIIGRDSETSRVIEILCRKTKNNPVLIGEAGVGKTSVVEGLAQRINEGSVPDILLGKSIFSVDVASLMAGTKFRGSLEQKIKDLIDEVVSNNNIILFIDEIHTLAEAGGKDGEISVVDILKPYLARGELHLIGTTTKDEYAKYIEKDPALERRFQPVNVEEPSIENAIKILNGIKNSFENFHGVIISQEAIESAVKLSARYITNIYVPDKAIDLIDEACSKIKVGSSSLPDEVRLLNLEINKLNQQKQMFLASEKYMEANNCNLEIAKLNGKIEGIKASYGKSFAEEITEDNIREVLSSWTNIPVQKLSSSEKEKLLNLENIIGQKVIGQDEAVRVVSKAIRRSRAGVNDPNRPIGSFLFLGPTGVGKTELTKVLSDVVFDSENSIVRFDMSEFKESHSISRLIGAPPGYVGHDDGGELTEAVKRNPYCVVLFDEIEKAHPDIYNILLQIFDEGRLTDSKGKLINFKNTIIILTSNNGVQDLIARRKFERENPGQARVETQEFLMDKLRDCFKPELINRIDQIVIFDTLSKESVLKISNIMLDRVIKNFKNVGISLEIEMSAKQLLCEKGYDEMYGARPLRKVIDREVIDPLSDMKIAGEIGSSSAVRVYADAGKINFQILC